MKVASAKTKKPSEALLYLAGMAFFTLILLAPYMIIEEVASGQMSPSGEGSTLRQVGYLVVLILSIFAALRQGAGFKSLMLPWPLLLALGWCWLSVAWAVNPDVATRRIVLTTIAVWNTFIIVQSAGYARAVAMLRILFVVLLVVNYLAVLLEPQVGIHLMRSGGANTSQFGNWRGIMGHKNIAGSTCAVTIILFLCDAKQIKRWLQVAVIVAAGYFLYRTQSKTSAGMLPIALLCAWIFQRYDNRIRTFAIPMIMFATAIGWFIVSTYKSLVLDNYLNPTFFTGRGTIWEAMFRYSGDHLMTGAGFGSFWNIGADSPIFQYGRDWVRNLATGHNGYLDLLATIGLPGLVLTIFAAIVWPTWKLLTGRIPPPRGALSVALLLFCIGHNVTESSLLERDALVGIIMMVAVAIAQNWRESVAQAARKVTGDNLFSFLASRSGEHA